MTRQNINTGSVANDKTGDTLRVAGNKINANFVELYTLLGGDSSAATNKVQFADSGVQFNGLTHNSVIGVVEGNQKNTYLLGDSEGTVTINTATQTLTNKTLTSPVLTTPQINDTSADHQYVVAVAELAADRNVNLPLLTDSDTFVFQAHTQTLTNKTITSPIINTPRLVGTVSDTNGAEMIEITATGSAANHFSKQTLLLVTQRHWQLLDPIQTLHWVFKVRTVALFNSDLLNSILCKTSQALLKLLFWKEYLPNLRRAVQSLLH